MEPLVLTESVILMSSSGGPLVTESVEFKGFVRLKTPRWVTTEAPAYLSEEGTKIRDTLPDLKARMEPSTVAFLWHPEFSPPTKEPMFLDFR